MDITPQLRQTLRQRLLARRAQMVADLRAEAHDASGQMALRNCALALSGAGSSASTSTVPKSFGSTVRVRVMVSPFTVIFTSCPPEEAL